MHMALIKPLAWDSDFFGLSVGRYEGNTLDATSAKKLLNEFKEQKYDCVYAFLSPGDYPTALTAAQNNFLLSDIKNTFELSSRWQPDPMQSQDFQIDVIASGHKKLTQQKPTLISSAESLSQVSRFSFDPAFQHKAVTMYKKWVENIYGNKDGFFTLTFQNNKLIGFIGCTLKEKEGNLGLVWVDAPYQGKGAGRAMVQKSIEELKKRGAQRITVVTQQRNFLGNRLYESSGFRLADTQLVYHIHKHLRTS
jgi:dTDP-4-amino-4,6-dideoxy-D-galactose acyltransferase